MFSKEQQIAFVTNEVRQWDEKIERGLQRDTNDLVIIMREKYRELASSELRALLEEVGDTKAIAAAEKEGLI